jgi:hypothetical protein
MSTAGTHSDNGADGETQLLLAYMGEILRELEKEEKLIEGTPK